MFKAATRLKKWMDKRRRGRYHRLIDRMPDSDCEMAHPAGDVLMGAGDCVYVQRQLGIVTEFQRQIGIRHNYMSRAEIINLANEPRTEPTRVPWQLRFIIIGKHYVVKLYRNERCSGKVAVMLPHLYSLPLATRRKFEGRLRNRTRSRQQHAGRGESVERAADEGHMCCDDAEEAQLFPV